MLAKKVHVSRASIYAYLSGETLPKADVFDRILLALDLPAAEHARLATTRDDLEYGQQDDGPDTVSRPPCQLPSGVHPFTGREDHLARLERLVAARQQGRAVLIVALSGTADAAWRGAGRAAPKPGSRRR